MKKTKKLLSFFLAIMMVITTIPAFTITSNAADFNGTLTNTGAYIIYNSIGNATRKDRYETGSLNICNDGGSNNFCSGWWGFSISSIPSSIDTITAEISITVPNSHTGNTGVSVYATNNSITADTSVLGSGATARDNALAKFPDKKLLGTYTSTSAGTFSADIGDAIKQAKQDGWANFNIFAIQSGVGNGNDSNNNWSDVWFKKPVITVNATELIASNVTVNNNAKSVINRVVLDDAIYTYGSSSEYYNYGTTISTDAPWDTQVIFKSGSASDIASITCVDDSGARLSLNGSNVLQGSFSDNKFKVSDGATNVNATLMFTFKDGAKEFHRVAVKSYPVETHVCSFAEKGGSAETGYTMFMRGSTGTDGNKGVWKYYKSYYTSGTTAHGAPDKNYYSTGKNALTYAYGYSGGSWGSSAVNADPSTVPTSTYYIDKSCKDTSWAGLGNSEYWNGSNYNIPIDVVRTRFNYPSGTANSNFDINNMPIANSIPKPSSINMGDTNGLTTRLTFTHNASVNESNRSGSDTSCNVRIATRKTDKGYALLKTNVIVNLFDKSTARTAYNNALNEGLKEENYTATSFTKYQNALLNLESYLSNYEDTNTSKMTSLVNSLNTARNNLVVRGDTQTVLNKVAAFQAAATEQSNSNKYTTTSYNNFVNEQIFNPSDDLNAALNLKNDTLAQRELTESLANTYISAVQHYLDILVECADFTYYNEQADAVAGNLTNYTAKDGQYIRLYSVLQPYESITLYTDAQKADTPKTSQTTVNNVGSAIANANTGVYNSNPVDQSALTSFTTEFANFDTDVYTESVVNAKVAEATGLYKSITFDSTQYFGLDVADQTDLDNKLTSYLNAINDSINTYNVTVPSTVTATASYVATATDNGNGTKTYAYPLGTNVTFTNGNADTAWYMAVQSNNTTRGQQYQTFGKSFTTKVVGNLTITAESSVAATPYYVAIIREYDKAGTGKAIDRVNYVANNSTYTLPTPTKIANYNFVEYVVNGETKAAGDIITITADTEITAKYQYADSDLTVTVNGTAKTCAYNESVTVRASGAYAWVEKTGADTWRPFYIGSAVTFRATESTELKSVTELEFKAMFTDEAYAPNLRLNGVLVDADNRAVFHAQRIDYLPAGAQVVEFGILMNTASSTDFDLGNDKGVGEKNEKTVRLKSTQSLDKVQFNIFVKNAGSRAFTYKSYMIYKLADGTVKTVYSDVITKA